MFFIKMVHPRPLFRAFSGNVVTFQLISSKKLSPAIAIWWTFLMDALGSNPRTQKTESDADTSTTEQR